MQDTTRLRGDLHTAQRQSALLAGPGVFAGGSPLAGGRTAVNSSAAGRGSRGTDSSRKSSPCCVQACRQAFAGDPARRLELQSASLMQVRSFSGMPWSLTPGPRTDQGSVAAAPTAGRSIPAWRIRVEQTTETRPCRGRRLRPAVPACTKRHHSAVQHDN